MKNAKYKIALASVCGAVIGYGLGTTVLSGAWLILAGLLGGVCGWIAFDFRALVNAFSQALQNTVREGRLELKTWWAVPWREILPQAVSASIEPFFVFQAIGSAIAFFPALLVTILPNSAGPYSFWTVYTWCYGFFIVLGLLISMLAFILEIDTDNVTGLQIPNRKKVFVPREEMVFGFKFFALTNPIVMPFTMAWILIKELYPYARKAIVWMFRRIPLVPRLCWLVTARTFGFAHNNGRLASFVGASVGSIIGVIAGHPLVAMAIGATIGMLAHYVGAFFSKSYIDILLQNIEVEKARL
jgi:hypothetical protein